MATRHGRRLGGKPAGFDFTSNMRQVCEDMVRRLPELQHIDLARVAIAWCKTRKRVSHGLYASLTPMRFSGGETTELRNNKKYTVQRLVDDDGREMLYILSFYLPRFMDTTMSEKLITILHELWHISPNFDGDIRRHPGRCYAHSHSQQEYDQQMAELAARWLMKNPPRSLYEFLGNGLERLQERYGGIFGTRIPQPKLIPIDTSPGT
jgi:hypothetical protein